MDRLSNLVEQLDDLEDSTVDLSALQQAFDTTFGRSSTPLSAQHSVKFQLSGSRMIVRYGAFINFASERNLTDQKLRYSSEATTVINAHMKVVKDRYKSICGKTLSVKEVNTTDSVEVTGMNSFNARKTALFRQTVVYDIA